MVGEQTPVRHRSAGSVQPVEVLYHGAHLGLSLDSLCQPSCLPARVWMALGRILLALKMWQRCLLAGVQALQTSAHVYAQTSRAWRLSLFSAAQSYTRRQLIQPPPYPRNRIKNENR
jgi:hypothetical protein